jgi:3',5'-cyclic AMP phosphodiesterase CpdA
MSLTLAHLSDAHLSPAPFPPLAEMRLKRFMGFVNWKRSRERTNDMPMLGRLVADMRQQKPDHIAMTGDVVNLALAIEFRRAAEWLKTLGATTDVSFTPGNHDAYVRDAMANLRQLFAPWTTTDGEPPKPGVFPYLRVRNDVALIGLSSGLPTAPLLASGRLGKGQIAELKALLKRTGAAGLARVVLIHHPPLARGGVGGFLRGLDDAAAFEAAIAEAGAEAILHGHSHRRMLHHLPSLATKLRGGNVPVIGAPSCSAGAQDASHRAAYYLVRLERAGERWRVGVRARGPLPASGGIGEQEPVIAWDEGKTP